MNAKPDYNQLYETAEGQGGYFTSSQAREAGFSWERLSANVRTEKFKRISQGVYRLTHFPRTALEDLFIAWLRAGTNSVISHESALLIYDLSDVLPVEIHLIVPRTASRRQRGIRMHTNKLNPDEVNFREGLPVTTVARTIADIATGNLPEEQVRQAIQESLARGLVSPDELRFQVVKKKGRAARIIADILNEEMKP